MTLAQKYHLEPAAAYVRGSREAPVPRHLLAKPLADLSQLALVVSVRAGLVANLRLHPFKRTMGLARVERVLGILHGLQPASLLDVGTGRGDFLWPVLETFPAHPVTATDRDPRRVERLETVRAGGLERLTARRLDARAMDLPDDAFDVVTLLEVVEHIPEAAMAIAEAVRVARRHVVVSVPSKPDDNPEHIRRFDGARLTVLLMSAGAGKVNLAYVQNHLIDLARVGER
jgi:2-polyprenyl-3-methyl-5-hydroxy-6-metoxy-1,4-benzoquinol methylase